MAQITLETAGSRIYVAGNTYPIKDQLRQAGCHWDGDRKQWWIGAAKRDAITHLVETAGSQEAATSSNGERRDDKPSPNARVKARATYKGRDYYVLAESRDGARLLLASRNGALQFWAATEATRIVKEYGREWHGRVEYPTLARLMELSEEWRHMPEAEREERSQPLEEGYYRAGNGEILASGCSECRRLGTMCRSCQHDYE